ncbi:hypothetical protein [Rhizobium sp. Rhizsp42]|uniref:hypothetical protein n=1 Tax=Rhizobium sp. Rhizsp42 TaxID=3243034 RepID=UPI0039B0204A
MKPSDPEVSLFIFDALLKVGRTAKLRQLVELDRWKFEGHALGNRLDDICRRLQEMEKFELIYGPGSCINLEDPTTAGSAAAGHSRFDPTEIENAKNAPSGERAKILA